MQTDKYAKDFQPIFKFVNDTFAKIDSEAETSGALKGAMSEFLAKVTKVKDQFAHFTQGDENEIKKTLIEAEQAADSVKRAAQASQRVDKNLQKQILEAHDRIRDFRDKVLH